MQMTISSIMKTMLYQFLYNPNVHDCGWITISTHRTPEGAEKAKAMHKADAKKDWMEEFPTEELRTANPFGSNEDWQIATTELSD
jgi:hypothetical protein